MILGGGPNRIGQGIEFDYCCCQAASPCASWASRSIMVNSNPETVSTDYDTSDLLFFEPLTAEDVLNICDRVQPDGVIVQFGGQTPLNLARALDNAGVPIIGTSVDTIEAAEDREQFAACSSAARPASSRPTASPARCTRPAPRRPRSASPSLVRPSFVLGGRAMEIGYDEAQFERFVAEAFVVAQGQPVLIDKFLEDAIEVDVDCLSDGETRDRRRRHGAHRGSRRPLRRLGLRHPAVQPARPGHRGDPRGDAARMARQLQRRGPDEHPVRRQEGRRPAGRLRPRSQPAGQPHRAVRLQGDRRAAGQDRRQGDGRHDARRAGRHARADPAHVSVKESVFPFNKFAGVDIILGPEMRAPAR